MSEICGKSHKLFSKLDEFRFPFDAARIPQNGIYILFEKDELAHETNRIVRVGTHTGNDNLASRLNEHFITPNKDRSIFRKHIGRTILNKNDDPFLKDWNRKLTKAEITRDFPDGIYARKIQELEELVTACIRRNFYFVVFKVDEQAERRNLESKIISTVSLCKECKPSKNWFGQHSPKNKIRESGLWLIQGLYKEEFLLSENDYQELEENVLD